MNFGAVKLTKNVDFDQYSYSGYGIGFDACGSFLLSDGAGFGKNIIFGMSPYVRILMIKRKIS